MATTAGEEEAGAVPATNGPTDEDQRSRDANIATRARHAREDGSVRRSLDAARTRSRRTTRRRARPTVPSTRPTPTATAQTGKSPERSHRQKTLGGRCGRSDISRGPTTAADDWRCGARMEREEKRSRGLAGRVWSVCPSAGVARVLRIFEFASSARARATRVGRSIKPKSDVRVHNPTLELARLLKPLDSSRPCATPPSSSHPPRSTAKERPAPPPRRTK